MATTLNARRIRLLATHPLGWVVSRVKFRETTEVATAAVDLKEPGVIHINPAFAESLSDDELLCVVVHELGHFDIARSLRGT